MHELEGTTSNENEREKTLLDYITNLQARDKYFCERMEKYCLAAKETGRRYIGMEIDPEYHKIAVDRLNGINANGQTSIFTDFENL